MLFSCNFKNFTFLSSITAHTKFNNCNWKNQLFSHTYKTYTHKKKKQNDDENKNDQETKKEDTGDEAPFIVVNRKQSTADQVPSTAKSSISSQSTGNECEYNELYNEWKPEIPFSEFGNVSSILSCTIYLN